MDDQTEVTSAAYRQAASGQVGYDKPVVLHETSKTRIEVMPYFISHSQHTGLKVRLSAHSKSQSPVWGETSKEDRQINLDEDATVRLREFLQQRMQVAAENEPGEYLLVRVSEGTANLAEHDPGAVASALVKLLSSSDIVSHISDADLSAELVVNMRRAMRIADMRRAVEDLENSLNQGEVAESVYQRWCSSHSWAFGNAYVMQDDVRDISAGDSLDILLPLVISGYRDIVELKRPDMDVLLWDKAHRNYYFGSEVSKAIGQCHRYLDILHDTARKGLLDHPEVVAYHPRAIVVIGRSADWETDRLTALHGLNHRLNGVMVMTYDQLLAQGKRLIETLEAEAPEGEVKPDKNVRAARLQDVPIEPEDLPF